MSTWYGQTTNMTTNNALQLVKVSGTVQWWGGTALRMRTSDRKLMDACLNEDVKEAKDALEEGANPNICLGQLLNETYPLHLVARTGNVEIAELLMRCNCNINARNNFDGSTAIHMAARNGHVEFCQFLIANGSDVSRYDKLGRTALMESAEIGAIDIVKLLVETEEDVNVEDRERFTPLSYALDGVHVDVVEDDKHWECVKYLLENGANPNYAGKYTRNSMMTMAVRRNDFEMVQKLNEEYGFYLYRHKDRNNKTALIYAKELGYTEIMNYLTELTPNEESAGLCEITCIVL